MNSRREFRENVKTCGEGSTQQLLFPKLFGTLRLFILFFLFSSNAFSQNNLGNQQYDLNDPRNPDCPCHKLQKLADDEYDKIQNIVNQQQFTSNVNFSNNIANNINQPENKFNPLENNFKQEGNNFNQVDNNIGNDNSSHQKSRDFSLNKREVSGGSGSTGSKVKKKPARPAGGNSGLWFQKKINRSKLKNFRIKKVRPNYSVCYKW